MLYFINQVLYKIINPYYVKISYNIYKTSHGRDIMFYGKETIRLIKYFKIPEKLLKNLVYHTMWASYLIFRHQKLSESFLYEYLDKIIDSYKYNRGTNDIDRYNFSRAIIEKYACMLPVQNIFYHHTYDIDFVMNILIKQSYKFLAHRLLLKYSFPEDFISKFTIHHNDGDDQSYRLYCCDARNFRQPIHDHR